MAEPSIEQSAQANRTWPARRVVPATSALSSHSGFATGMVLVGLYAVVRTLATDETLLVVWMGAAVLATLAWPIGGLTVLAAIGPFTEALTADGRITAAPVLVAALGFAVVLHAAVRRRLPPLSAPIVLAALLLVGTALGVVNAFRLAGPALGVQAAELWVPGIGGAMTVLLAAAWVGWHGEFRPLLVVAASIAVAALLSIADIAADGAVRTSPIGWLLRSDSVQERLGGIIPAPNAVAAILLVALAVAVAIVLFARRPDLRLIALATLPPVVLALVLTYSRSALLGVAAVAGLMAWRKRRGIGVAVVLIALVGAVAVTPGFLSARRVVVNSANPPAVGQWGGDEQRVGAWNASVRMWMDEPLTGHGFRSFEWLNEQYGVGYITAPHNEWLRLFAEGGLFVGLVGVGLALSTVVVLTRARGWIAAGGAAAAAAIFVMANFNNPFLYTQVNVPAFLVIGTALGLAARPPRSPPEQAPPEAVERR